MKSLSTQSVATRFLLMIGASTCLLGGDLFLSWWFRQGLLFDLISEAKLTLGALIGVIAVVVVGCYSYRADIRWYQWPALFVLVYLPAQLLGFLSFVLIACSLPYGCI